MDGEADAKSLRRRGQELVHHAVRRGGPPGRPDWLEFVNTAFNVAMRGHQNEIYDKALNEYFGIEAPVRPPGFPSL